MSYPPREPDEPPSPYEPPPSPYGPPGQYGSPAGQGRGTNILAVLSLVFAFAFAPAGIVLGHVAKRQIRRTGEHGDQLATWGLILGYVFTVIGLIACCGWIGLVFWGGSTDGSSYH
ncbi:DUF4190 domain-containing protein [Micromonospora sp. NPDC002575]|uniref:DUF4190 domain-containing protein n=1 Tax=Micromonospora sp. NPDC002575 TaxID=3364222 RepID=UPI0036AD1E48